MRWKQYNKLSEKDRTEYWYRIGIWRVGTWIPLILLYFYLIPILGTAGAAMTLNASIDGASINMLKALAITELFVLLVYAIFFLIMEIGTSIGERVWLIQKGYRKTMFGKEDFVKNLKRR